MLESVRLFWRTARFEILAGLGVSLALTAGVLAVAARLDAIRLAACPALRVCEDAAWIDIQTTFAGPLLSAGALVPLVIGLLYGPALVGRELERRSAPLSWSLVRSRARWLAWRAWPAALLVALLLVGPALAGDRLEAAAKPQFDPAQSFYDVGSRGELVVLRGVVAFAIGLAAGVVLGRTLPAVLLAGALCVVGLGLAANARPAWLPREEISIDEFNQGTKAVPLSEGLGVRMPDGHLLTDAESAPLRPPDAQDISSPAYTLWVFQSGAHKAYVGISGVHFRDVELRDAAVTGAVALVAFLVALVAVRHRRPVPGIGIELEARRNVAAGTVAVWRAQPRWRRSGAYLSWLTAIRVGRVEVLGAMLASIAVTGATVLVIRLLADARVTQGCVATACEGYGPFHDINNPLGDWLYPLLATLPFVVGGLFGAPVIARELESGTGRLTWSLTGGRLRWLLWRIVPLILLMFVLLIPAAIAGSRLLYQRELLDPTYYFSDGQIRGATLVARGFALFGIGLLAGVVFRRILPALVVTAIVGILLYSALDWTSTEGRWLTPDVLGPAGETTVNPGSQLLTDALQAPDGSFHLASEVALANGFPRLNADGDPIEVDPSFIVWYTDRGYRYVTIGWDRSRYPEVVLRESVVLFGSAVVCLAAAAIVLRRSRPG